MRKPNRLPHIEVASWQEASVNADSAGGEEERLRQVLHLIAEVETAAQYKADAMQRAEFARWLAQTPYTLRKLREAGDGVAAMETYGRPFAREFWFKAFAQPLIHPERIRELCRQAYEKGRREEREQAEAQRSSSGIDAITKRLLEAEKELMELREERNQMKGEISKLELEARAAKRGTGEPIPRFYRIGEELIVEHFRGRGAVYFHEQGVGETDIPTSRCRCLPTEEFDRQISAQRASLLTDEEITRLPGYRDW